MKATLSQGQEVLKLITQSGIGREDLQELLQSGELKVLLNKYVDGIKKMLQGRYPVLIDYSLPFWKRVKACQLDDVYDDITRWEDGVDVSGQVRKELVLLQLDCESYDYYLYKMKDYGLRAAKIEELVAFATQYPEMQKRFEKIVALGTVKRTFMNDLVAYLACDNNKRVLHFESWKSYWNKDCRFLAVIE